MIDADRIKEAESNVKQYLDEGLLKKETNKTAKEMHIENCDLSLETAKRLSELEDLNFKPYLDTSHIILCNVLYCKCSFASAGL